MKTILVGVDFTKSSENTLNYAILIAKQTHSKILLFHALTAPLIHSNSGLFFIAAENLTSGIEKKMKELQIQLSEKHKSVKFEIEITYDGIRNRVAFLSKNHKISLVVLGLEVKNKLMKLLTGTTALDLTGKINCPIITVPQKYKVHHITKMLIALDNKEPIQLKLSNLIHSTIKSLAIETEFVHIVTDKEAILNSIKYKRINITNFKSSNFESGLKTYAKKSNADLIMIISHHYSDLHNLFIETNSQKIILSSSIPVISIHN